MLFPFTLVGATALQPFCFHTSTYLGPLLLGPQIYYRNGFIQLQTRLLFFFFFSFVLPPAVPVRAALGFSNAFAVSWMH